MKNKEIQEKRMKEYFIQATKDILKGEGLKSLSVRNIADRAGYSYATLYNYFNDVNDLIFLCVSDFQEECRLFVANQTKKIPKGLDKIKAIVLAYISYFVEYPDIFDLFYIAKMGNFGNKQTTIDVINNSLNNVCETDWNYCVSRNLLQIKRIESIKSQLKYASVGLLLLYINRRTPNSYSEFMNQASIEIDNILGIDNEKNSQNIIMKANEKKDFLTEIKDCFKIVLEKVDDFVEQSSNTKETKELSGNIEKANNIFNDLMQEKMESIKNILKRQK